MSVSVCHLVSEGVWTIFGSKSANVRWLLSSLASTLHIPHLSIYWDYRTYSRSRSHKYENNGNNFTLSLHPEASLLSKAFKDFVLSRNWKSIALLFEENDGNNVRLISLKYYFLAFAVCEQFIIIAKLNLQIELLLTK